MPDLSRRTSPQLSASVTAEEISALRAALTGSAVTAGEDGYEDACSIWNAMIERRPGLVIRAAAVADVVSAIHLARERDLVLSVRGGGHNIAGNALCDGGLLLDMRLMNQVEVDPDARTARVGPGATLADFDAAAQAHGLATPLGINSTTGVAGLTLGGGFGWLTRKYGFTADNLISADVVTAGGERLTASATENPDLFWAIRGGGGNFGVITSFEFQLHPVGPEVLSGLIVHRLTDAPAVLREWRDFAAAASDDVSAWFVIRKAPPLPFLPEDVHGTNVLVLACFYAGSMENGEAELRPLREVGNPIADVVGPHPYAGWQQALDPLLTPGFRNYWKSHDFAEVTDDLLDVLIDYGARLPSVHTEIAFAQLGGAAGRVPSDAMAAGRRDARYLVNVHTRWESPAEDESCIRWARELHRDTEVFSTGAVYVNFMPEDQADTVQVRSAYGENFRRLVEIKRRYDPTNLFRMNQNIRPTALTG
jgi:FAD/FMN-containing dehydrogenase